MNTKKEAPAVGAAEAIDGNTLQPDSSTGAVPRQGATAFPMQRHIRIPRKLKDKRAVAELAYQICREVRSQTSTQNFQDARYEDYNDAIVSLCRDLELRERFPTPEDYDEFEYQIVEMWPDSASDNRFKLTAAIDAFHSDPEAFEHPSLCKPGLRRVATLCWRLALAHGGPDAEFYLSTRVIGDTVGTNAMTALRIMRSLTDTCGLIEITKRYPRGTRKGWHYRFRKSVTHIHTDTRSTDTRSTDTRQVGSSCLPSAGSRLEPTQDNSGPDPESPPDDVSPTVVDLEERRIRNLLLERGIPITDSVIMNAMITAQRKGFSFLKDNLPNHEGEKAVAWLRFMAS